MTLARPSRFLRFALLADAVATGATGLLLIFLSGFLARLLAIPGSLLFYSGLILVPFAAFVFYLFRRETLLRSAVFAVIAINILWAIDSVILAFSGWIAPSVLGYAFILFQAAVVGVFAELQYIGLRKSGGGATRAAIA